MTCVITAGKRERQMEESLERVEVREETVGDMDPVGFQECDERKTTGPERDERSREETRADP